MKKYSIAYSLIPYKRHQDVVEVAQEIDQPIQLIVSVVDGYNNPHKLPGNEAGLKTALFVQKKYPINFLSGKEKNIKLRAIKAAEKTDKQLLKLFPEYAACVGAFIFKINNNLVIITVGSIFVYELINGHWEKPKEIGDYSLDLKHYPYDVSRFFGNGENTKGPLYSSVPDITIRSENTQIFIASDGFESVMDKNELNKLTKKITLKNADLFINELSRIIKQRRNRQNDDIAVLIKV